MAKKAEKKPPKDFASARQRLDEILAELELDGGDVDRLAERIKEASGLIRFCRERLSAARAEVRSVVAELDAGEAPDAGPEGEAEPPAGPGDDEAPPLEEPPPPPSSDDLLDGPLDADALGEGSLPF